MSTNELDLFENLRLELRRGCLVLAVLAELRSEHYGYELRKALSDSGLEIDENTLYPLLRRLESQNLLVSHWRIEDKRNKRFYRLSADGEAVLKRLLVEWRGINESIGRLLGGANDESRTVGSVHSRGENTAAVEQAG
jgi:PadR family transcriptional regulator PadR